MAGDATTLSNAAAAKRDAAAWLERNRAALADLNDAIFQLAEPSLEEHETAALMSGLLEEAGFAVERGTSGFPTAFVATWGEGEPCIALHAEYDGCPNNSQVSGVTEQRPIVPGAPGHCEGHNGNATVLLGVAMAVKDAMRRHAIPGRLKIIGAPAEELVLSRPYFVRDGHLDDVDLAFHNHIWARLSTEYGQVQIAAINAEFTFHGETAHAGLAPWKGRDALDAVVCMDVGMAQFREHMRPTMRAHRVITRGGDQPNVIPSIATVWWCFRDLSAEGARSLLEQARRIADGAALMTNTRVEVAVTSAVWPVRCNETLARVIQRNIEAVGMPEWTEDEHDFARRLQAAAGVAQTGLKTEPDPLTGPMPEPIAASNDCGDISWKVPMGRLWWPGSVPGIQFHHWTGGAPLATSIAHKGVLVGSKVLAGAVLDCLLDPAVLSEAKRTFAAEIGDVVYAPLLPAGQKPTTEVHKGLMAKYRPLLAEHRHPRRPVFT